MKVFYFIWKLPRNVVIFLIKGYQRTLSPDHGWPKGLFPNGYCRFEPTCSEYAVKSLEKCGFVVGFGKALWRVMKCNPCSKGGVDKA